MLCQRRACARIDRIRRSHQIRKFPCAATRSRSLVYLTSGKTLHMYQEKARFMTSYGSSSDKLQHKVDCNFHIFKWTNRNRDFTGCMCRDVCSVSASNRDGEGAVFTYLSQSEQGVDHKHAFLESSSCHSYGQVCGVFFSSFIIIIKIALVINA